MELERARAEIVTAKAVLAATERNVAASQSSAASRLRIAQMALASWTRGESQPQQAELEGAIRVCIAELELDVEQSAAEVERTRTDADQVSRTADLVAKTQQLAMQEQQLKMATEQQSVGQIIAPHDGVVVYASQKSRQPNLIAL